MTPEEIVKHRADILFAEWQTPDNYCEFCIDLLAGYGSTNPEFHKQAEAAYLLIMASPTLRAAIEANMRVRAEGIADEEYTKGDLQINAWERDNQLTETD